ncbi:hypothetical protein JW905_11955, partial [bacterium]|nr:hypothetical protein [candidate division CSSED10-310 bacterium]
QITATYATLGKTDTATVDCTAPIISGVTVAYLDYESAVISWTTNEDSDSTVYYGTGTPSILFNDPAPGTAHEVGLNGLMDCTTYVFYVVSTDAAGNEMIDDNGGLNYHFTTYELVTILDADMNINPNWTISGGSWAWGQPTGGGGYYGEPDPTSGYTGDNVYGYNLSGDYANSMPEYHLDTPSFDCSGGTGVTLKYYEWLGVESNSWDHAYLRISTNGGASWTQIWTNGSTSLSGGVWALREYDLSAYADGQPDVRIRWTMGISDSSVVYCGWNIDDVLVYYSEPCLAPTATPVPPTATSTPTEIPTETPTMVPTDTPVPPTATPVPPTATPGCDWTGVHLLMPDDYFTPGEQCYLMVNACNPGPEAWNMLPFFVILDVYGNYWFAPAWGTDFTYYDSLVIEPGFHSFYAIDLFTWPGDAGSASGIKFWSAVTDMDITRIIGELGYVEFGWGEM